MADKRQQKPSFKKLVSNEDSSGSSLIDVISTAQDALGNDDPVAIRTIIANIKAAIKVFETDSRALSAHLSSQGSFLEASEVRSNRLKLVHGDGKEAVQNLNAQLVHLGEDAASSIHAASESHRSWHPHGSESEITHPRNPPSADNSDEESDAPEPPSVSNNDKVKKYLAQHPFMPPIEEEEKVNTRSHDI